MKLTPLLSSGVFLTIEKALDKYKDYLKATRGDVALLQEHRDRLLATARTDSEMLKSEDEGAIKGVLAKYEFYGSVVETHKAKLHQVLKRLVMVDVLNELSKSDEFAAVLNGLETYKDDCETPNQKSAYEAVMTERRDHLVTLAEGDSKDLTFLDLLTRFQQASKITKSTVHSWTPSAQTLRLGEIISP